MTTTALNSQITTAARVGVLSVAGRNPEHDVPQGEAKRFARDFFRHDVANIVDLEVLLESFDNAQIERRQLGRPLEWYGQARGFPEKNAAYVEQARLTSRAAAEAALAQAGIPRDSFGAIIFASTTGIATPTIDAWLVQELGLPRSITRVPLWGLGCAGGAAALGRATLLARVLERPVLVVACEMCSLTFVHGDRRPANVIAVALFGDGAAACVVAPEPWWAPSRGPELLSPTSHLVAGSEDVMGWDVEEQGLLVRFAPSIPGIAKQLAPTLIEEASAAAGLDRTQRIAHLVVHPGGRKVLDAFEEALELPPETLRHSRAVMREHGNMSSPTVLFVLERFLIDTPPSDLPGLLMALGPGFCAEGVVFRW